MATYAATLALLEWFALALQFYLALSLSVENGTGLLQGTVNYFSYFTILSNLIVALVLTCSRWSPNSRWGSLFARPTTQSAAAAYITIVGLVYSPVLRGIWDPQGLQKLVWMANEIAKGQLLSLHVGRMKDAGTVGHEHISMAKRNNVWMALECARMARDVLGANGITEDYPIMRHMMNLESVKTYEGTHDIHTLILGQSLTGIGAY